MGNSPMSSKAISPQSKTHGELPNPFRKTGKLDPETVKRLGKWDQQKAWVEIQAAYYGALEDNPEKVKAILRPLGLDAETLILELTRKYSRETVLNSIVDGNPRFLFNRETFDNHPLKVVQALANSMEVVT